MKVIGECLNTMAYSRVKDAVSDRNEEYIIDTAREMINHGAHYIDVHARNLEDMIWLVETVSQLRHPVSVDHSDPEILVRCMEYGEVKLVNSINCERTHIFEQAHNFGVDVIALLHNCDPDTVLKAAEEAGYRRTIYFDPVVMPMSVSPEEPEKLLSRHLELKRRGLHTVAGISNISYGMPEGSALKAVLLVMLMNQGLDAAIVNPSEMLWYIRAFQALKDASGRETMNYIKTYRSLSGRE